VSDSALSSGRFKAKLSTKHQATGGARVGPPPIVTLFLGAGVKIPHRRCMQVPCNSPRAARWIPPAGGQQIRCDSEARRYSPDGREHGHGRCRPIGAPPRPLYCRLRVSNTL